MAITTLLNAVTTTGASSAADTADADYVRVQVFSAATSSCTVQIQQSINGTTWFPVATITDPTSTGEIWSVAPIAYTRANVTARVSGTITAICHAERAVS